MTCVLLLALAAAPPGALASGSANWGKGVQATPPANAGSNPEVSLRSVSCTSPGDCTAVGDYLDSSGNQQGVVFTEASGTWGTGVESALPANEGSNPHTFLDEVRCPSAGDCTAIGYYTDSSGKGQVLLLSETAGTWGTGVEATLPADAASEPEVLGPRQLSCPSAGSCTAAGVYTDSSGRYQGLLLSETSGTWGTGIEATMPANVNASHPHVSMNGISCPSVGNCTAVGEYNDSVASVDFLLTETSGTWGAAVQVMAPANAEPAGSMMASGVSCPSAGNCTAAGEYFDTSGNMQGFLLSETAGTWGTGVEAIPPANGGSKGGVRLNEVQCPSAGNCTAVGEYFDTLDNNQGLLLSETSGTWGTGVEVPLPANARSGPLGNGSSLSCPSAGNCDFVNEYYVSAGDLQGLLLTESSGMWGPGLEASLPANAGSSKPEVSLNSVSCSSPGDCTAVGQYADSSEHRQGLLLAAAPATAYLSASGPLGGAFAGSPIAASSISATLAGGVAPSGTITFTVFGPQSAPPSSCSSGGTTVGTASASGDGIYQPSAGFTPPSPGEYWWYASYGGDVGDNPSASTCGLGMAETSVLPKATPTLSASGPMIGAFAGSPIAASSISAALAGGSAPTGTITFTVFGPQSSPPSSCTAGGTTVGTASVNGDGTYQSSAGYTPPSPGEYWWYAGYGGDAGDEPAASACGPLMGQTLVAAAPTTPSSPGTGSSGPGSGAGSGTGARTPAPKLSGVKLASKRSTGKKGTALKLTLSQPATIKVLIAQNVKAHKHGGVCKPTAKKGESCTATVEKRTLTFSGPAGSNTFELRTAGLGKGSYTATIIAENANGKSSPARLSFTITNK